MYVFADQVLLPVQLSLSFRDIKKIPDNGEKKQTDLSTSEKKEVKNTNQLTLQCFSCVYY